MSFEGQELEERFGRLLRQRRTAAGLTQESLAAKAGVSRASVVNIERGRQGVSLSTLYQLADALDCQPSALLPAPAEIAVVDVLIGHASPEDEEVLMQLKRRMASGRGL